MGALVAEAADEDVQELAKLGWNIGLAFQIQDDILDSFGDPKLFGKKVGGDICQNKKTWLVLKANEVGTADQVTKLKSLMDDAQLDDDTKVTQVKDLLTELNIPALAEQAKGNYQKAAFENLASLSAPPQKKENLKMVMEQLIGRTW